MSNDKKNTGFAFEGAGNSVSVLDPYGRHPSQPPPGHVIDMGPFANIKRANVGSSSSGRGSSFFPSVSDFEDDGVVGDGTSQAVVEAPATKSDRKRFYGQKEGAVVEAAQSMFDVDDAAGEKQASSLATPSTSAMEANNEDGLILTGTPPYEPADTGPPPTPAPSTPPKMTPGTARIVERLMKERELRAIAEADAAAAEAAKQQSAVDDQKKKEERSRAGSGGGDSINRADSNVTNMPKLGMSQLLQMVGVPDEITSLGGEVVAGVMEKHAALVDAPDESALYMKRDDVHPVALGWFLGGRYGTEWLTWEMETIAKTVLDDTGIDLSDVVLSKIAAIKLATNKPEVVREEWNVFEKVCVAFDGDIPRVSIVEDLSPETMTFGVLCLQAMQPDWTPSQELKTYMAARLFDAGFIVPPPALGMVDKDLQKLGAVDQSLRKAVLVKYARYLQDLYVAEADEDLVDIQVMRLLRCNAYAIDKADDIIRQLS